MVGGGDEGHNDGIKDDGRNRQSRNMDPKNAKVEVVRERRERRENGGVGNDGGQ
ncbi:UNVERIFIED_CONTAM: hypothetical protein Sradi_4037600 [Sesamum radiatum]|uniref:Uncharacterized protein n=1 Tax=Sesamum radiatum TaxID=300843 RepID=A0AAW2PI51_SESRA